MGTPQAIDAGSGRDNQAKTSTIRIRRARAAAPRHRRKVWGIESSVAAPAVAVRAFERGAQGFEHFLGVIRRMLSSISSKRLYWSRRPASAARGANRHKGRCAPGRWDQTTRHRACRAQRPGAWVRCPPPPRRRRGGGVDQTGQAAGVRPYAGSSGRRGKLWGSRLAGGSACPTCLRLRRQCGQSGTGAFACQPAHPLNFRNIEHQRNSQLAQQQPGQSQVVFKRPLLGGPAGHRRGEYERAIGQGASGRPGRQRENANCVGSAGGRGEVEIAIHHMRGGTRSAAV